MAKCPNCGTTLTCGCQKRVVNGVTGCSKCLTNTSAKTVKTTKQAQQTQPAKPAKDLNAFGKNRYNTLNKFTK